MFIYVGGGGGPNVAVHVYKMASVVLSWMQKLSRRVFLPFAPSLIKNENTLLKTSQTNRKCAQESLSGKKWVLKS